MFSKWSSLQMWKEVKIVMNQFWSVSTRFQTAKCTKGFSNSFLFPFLPVFFKVSKWHLTWLHPEGLKIRSISHWPRINSFQEYKSLPLKNFVSFVVPPHSTSITVQIKNEFQNPVHHPRHPAGYGNINLRSQACPCTSMWYRLSTNSARKESMLHRQ